MSERALKRAMLAHVEGVLDQIESRTTIVNVGATRSVIGAAYELAKQRGFPTSGIIRQRAVLQPPRGSADCVVDQVKVVIIARLLGLTIPASPALSQPGRPGVRKIAEKFDVDLLFSTTDANEFKKAIELSDEELIRIAAAGGIVIEGTLAVSCETKSAADYPKLPQSEH